LRDERNPPATLKESHLISQCAFARKASDLLESLADQIDTLQDAFGHEEVSLRARVDGLCLRGDQLCGMK